MPVSSGHGAAKTFARPQYTVNRRVSLCQVPSTAQPPMMLLMIKCAWNWLTMRSYLTDFKSRRMSLLRYMPYLQLSEICKVQRKYIPKKHFCKPTYITTFKHHTFAYDHFQFLYNIFASNAMICHLQVCDYNICIFTSPSMPFFCKCFLTIIN